MDLLHLGERRGEHAVRVVVAQVLLGDERRLLQVVEALDGIGVKAGVVEALLVERHVLVARDHGLLDALELDLLDLLVGRVENLLHITLPSEPKTRCADSRARRARAPRTVRKLKRRRAAGGGRTRYRADSRRARTVLVAVIAAATLSSASEILFWT